MALALYHVSKALSSLTLRGQGTHSSLALLTHSLTFRCPLFWNTCITQESVPYSQVTTCKSDCTWCASMDAPISCCFQVHKRAMLVSHWVLTWDCIDVYIIMILEQFHIYGLFNMNVFIYSFFSIQARQTKWMSLESCKRRYCMWSQNECIIQ